jgi:hypothetical protein
MNKLLSVSPSMNISLGPVRASSRFFATAEVSATEAEKRGMPLAALSLLTETTHLPYWPQLNTQTGTSREWHVLLSVRDAFSPLGLYPQQLML